MSSADEEDSGPLGASGCLALGVLVIVGLILAVLVVPFGLLAAFIPGVALADGHTWLGTLALTVPLMLGMVIVAFVSERMLTKAGAGRFAEEIISDVLQAAIMFWFFRQVLDPWWGSLTATGISIVALCVWMPLLNHVFDKDSESS